MKSTRGFEEYAYVLDFNPRGRSIIIKGKEGPVIQAIGEDWFTLLEILTLAGEHFIPGDRIYIGKEGRKKVLSVLGRIEFDDLTNGAKNELPNICEIIVQNNEYKFVNFFNESMSITPRRHSLDLISGIGKTLLKQILKERERKPFESYEDIETRIGLKDPAKRIAKRLVSEISGESGMTIFIKKIK